MKKLVKAIALLLALVMCLSVTVLATEPDAANDLAKIYAEDGVLVSFAGEKIEISCEVSESGFFLVVVKLDDGKDPNEDNILYIDQAVAANGAVECSVYASREEGVIEDSIVMLYGPGLGEGKLLATIESAVKPGDVTGDNLIDSADAMLLLQYVAGLTELDAEQQKAGNVTGGDIDSADAMLLLQVVAGLATLD